MDKLLFKAKALSLGWVEDRFGHLTSPSGQSRLKLQARSVRMERKYTPESMFGYKPPSQWLNVVSDYYSNITETEAGTPVIKGRALKRLA